MVNNQNIEDWDYDDKKNEGKKPEKVMLEDTLILDFSNATLTINGLP